MHAPYFSACRDDYTMLLMSTYMQYVFHTPIHACTRTHTHTHTQKQTHTISHHSMFIPIVTHCNHKDIHLMQDTKLMVTYMCNVYID